MLLNTFFSDAILCGFYLFFFILSMCIVRFLNGFNFFSIDIVHIQTQTFWCPMYAIAYSDITIHAIAGYRQLA